MGNQMRQMAPEPARRPEDSCHSQVRRSGAMRNPMKQVTPEPARNPEACKIQVTNYRKILHYHIAGAMRPTRQMEVQSAGRQMTRTM